MGEQSSKIELPEGPVGRFSIYLGTLLKIEANRFPSLIKLLEERECKAYFGEIIVLR